MSEWSPARGLVLVLALWAGCHRSPLVGASGTPEDTGVPRTEVDGASSDAPMRPDPAPDAPLPAPDVPPPRSVADVAIPDAAPGVDQRPSPSADAAVLSPPIVPGCTPRPEECNSIDDDCDGQIDEDLPAIPCPGGGSRYCVAGRMSACPRSCDVCRPGSQRVCFISYCTYWGTQTCAGDGRSFGLCKESRVPPECEAVSRDQGRSRELERCCIDNGYCCLDEFDLDNDGDRTELVGRCGGVTCPP